MCASTVRSVTKSRSATALFERPFGDEREDLAFARAELGQRVVGALATHDARHDRGVDDGLALAHATEGVHEDGRMEDALLQQIPDALVGAFQEPHRVAGLEVLLTALTALDWLARRRSIAVMRGGCGIDYDVRWRLDGDALSLRLAHIPWSHTSADFANAQTFIDRVWTRIEGPGASGATAAIVPPDGVYRTEISSKTSRPGASTMECCRERRHRHADDSGPQGAIAWESGATASYVARSR